MTCHQIHVDVHSRGHNEELAVDGKYYVDNLEIPHPSRLKDEVKQDILPNNQQPLVRPAAPERHGKEKKEETIEPEAALEVPTLLDTGSASAPHHYDTQKDSEQVLQEGTEAKIKVSQFYNNKQLANSDTLHGKPGLWPAEPLL